MNFLLVAIRFEATPMVLLLQVFYGTTSGASCLSGSVLTNPRTNHNRRRTDGS